MSVLSWRAWQAHLAPPSNEQTKVLLKRPYLHAAGASLHQPKYSLHVAFALGIMGGDVHPFFRRMNVTRQTSRRPRRAPNHQPTYSSNGPIFMQLASRSTNQSTHLNGAIFMSHSIFVSWAATSILSFLAWMWQDKQVGALTALQTSNQSTPQTVLSSCAAGASLNRPKYSIKRFNLHVALALHVMGVGLHPWSSRMHITSSSTGIRRPLRPLLASWDWNLFVSLQL
jgi:hypothetical protein